MNKNINNNHGIEGFNIGIPEQDNVYYDNNHNIQKEMNNEEGPIHHYNKNKEDDFHPHNNENMSLNLNIGKFYTYHLPNAEHKGKSLSENITNKHVDHFIIGKD